VKYYSKKTKKSNLSLEFVADSNFMAAQLQNGCRSRWIGKSGEEPTHRETEDALQIAKDCSDAIFSRLPAKVRS